MAARDALPGHFSCLKGKSVQFARVGPPPVRPVAASAREDFIAASRAEHRHKGLARRALLVLHAVRASTSGTTL